MSDPVDVAVVGGGPAGAVVAALLAQAGRSVVVLDRRPAYRWHACGVFSGPAVRPLLRDVGVGDAEIPAIARAVPAMRLETPDGTTVRLAYGADRGGPSALAFDRARLDERLLELSVMSGATVCRGTAVHEVDLDADRPRLRVAGAGVAGAGVAGASVAGAGGSDTLVARLVIGADGIRSMVARAAGVAREPRLRRVALTFHVAEDARPSEPEVDARMLVLGDSYLGLAPVPGGRVNVGWVLRDGALRGLRAAGAAAASHRVLRSIPAPARGTVRLADPRPLDRPAGASPLGHRVARRAGQSWLLVGDAAGFLDPFTGEGLHRALASAFLAAEAAERRLRGDRAALRDYDRAMHRRFAGKDAVSLLVQAFLARPRLFEYATRRLARRSAVRRTLEAVIGDLVPASRAFDPRFLAALLAP